MLGKENGADDSPSKMSKFELKLGVLLFAFFIMCVGSEITFAQFIYTFTQRELAPLLNSTRQNALIDLLKAADNPVRNMASWATFLFWLGFCLFRLFAIVQARYMKARTMLWINLTGCVAASVALLFSYDITLSFIAIFIFGSSLGEKFTTVFIEARRSF